MKQWKTQCDAYTKEKEKSDRVKSKGSAKKRKAAESTLGFDEDEAPPVFKCLKQDVEGDHLNNSNLGGAVSDFPAMLVMLTTLSNEIKAVDGVAAI